jgi:hypothetical protein
VTKPELMKKLEAMFDEIEHTRTWCNIEIEFREGVANMLRTTKNEKLVSTQENTRGPQKNFR